MNDNLGNPGAGAGGSPRPPSAFGANAAQQRPAGAPGSASGPSRPSANPNGLHQLGAPGSAAAGSGHGIGPVASSPGAASGSHDAAGRPRPSGSPGAPGPQGPQGSSFGAAAGSAAGGAASPLGGAAAAGPKSNPGVVGGPNDGKNGQSKCPRCGSTEISPSASTGKLVCNFCRHVFDMPKAFADEQRIDLLEGRYVGAGAQDIAADAQDLLTLKCESCGAEVVIDTSSAASARCHWCRSELSVNSQIPNGAIPDAALPFSLPKQEAEERIAEFVGDRRFFANRRFLGEFSPENVRSVFLPYMLVDVNAGADMRGEGEKTVRVYTEKDNNGNSHTYYDADRYEVGRSFDVAIDDLLIEASRDKIDYGAEDKTVNVINAILPFDTKNLTRFNANILKGSTSEKRSVNIDLLEPAMRAKAGDIARLKALETLDYDRGVAWSNEDFKLKGESWHAVYLPVWLYSYLETRGGKQVLHYVAVNGRNGKTMGSVPLNKPRLLLISLIVSVVAFIAGWFLPISGADDAEASGVMLFVKYLLLPGSGFAYYAWMKERYRNLGARHHYETETQCEVRNLKRYDKFIRQFERLSNSRIEGDNCRAVRGANVGLADVEEE